MGIVEKLSMLNFFLSILKKIKFLLPFGFIRLYEKINYKFRQISMDRRFKPFLKKNKIFFKIHKGKRCFILGCSPSIYQQNLIFLKNEISIALNLFYLHKDYDHIIPKYHLYSGLVNHPNIPIDKIGINLYKEMEKKILSDVIFLNCKDRDIITKNGLFKNKSNRIKYIHYSVPFDYLFEKGIDISKPIYRAYNIAAIALQIAIYMGFKEIYLLGLEHDWLIKFADRRFTHFYGGDNIIDNNGLSEFNNICWENEFNLYSRLWHDYRLLKKFADIKGIKIYNSTKGGILDVFPRVEYEKLF